MKCGICIECWCGCCCWVLCCCVYRRGCGWGPPTPHFNLYPTSTHKFHIHITHYPHTHPQLTVSVGLRVLMGPHMTQLLHLPQNPHNSQFMSKSGWWAGGADGFITWMNPNAHSQSSRRWTPAHPPPSPKKGISRGTKKTVLQVLPNVAVGDLPGWWGGGWILGGNTYL